MATNLTANWPLRFKGEAKTEKFVMDTAAAHIVYQGCPLMIDDNVDTDHLVPSSYITVATSDAFVGIAAEYKAVKIGSPEDELNNSIEVYVEPTIIGFKSAASPVFTNADLGVVVSMDGTGLLNNGASGAMPRIGKLYKVEDGYDFVQLETPWVQA